MDDKHRVKNYQRIIADLKEKIRHARLSSALTVNVQLLALYWEIGRTISRQEKSEGWGAKIVDTLSKDLTFEFPDMKGLSPRNLRYMREFAVAYPQFQILQALLAILPETPSKTTSTPMLQPPVAKFDPSSMLQPSVAKLYLLVASLPWAHNVVLLEKVKDPGQRVFYARKAIENSWSRDLLVYHIKNNLHKRQGKALTNFEVTLPKPQSDLARETLKNPYVFDFLGVSEEMQEREVERALVRHIKKFMLELGKGFAYVGNQYNLNVEGDEYFLDLLFYNYLLHSFVVFELKMGEFKPEYAGKLNFYVNTIDEQIRGKDDQPTLGVLLCKTPNHTVIKFALKGITTPMGVADYELAQTLPAKLKNQMPTVQELEQALDFEPDNSQNTQEQPLSRIKEILLAGKKKRPKQSIGKKTTKRVKRKKGGNG